MPSIGPDRRDGDGCRMEDMIRLIEPLIPALRRYARALMRDASEADDIVQDCLERAVGGWSRRRAEGDSRTWIFTILHNVAMNRLDQLRRRGRHLPIEDAAPAALSRPPTQEDSIGRRDLLRALSDLPEEQRTIMLLVSVEGLSYAEVAQILDIPPGTVMSRLSRGRERMRCALAGETPPAPIASHLRRVK